MLTFTIDKKKLSLCHTTKKSEKISQDNVIEWKEKILVLSSSITLYTVNKKTLFWTKQDLFQPGFKNSGTGLYWRLSKKRKNLMPAAEARKSEENIHLFKTHSFKTNIGLSRLLKFYSTSNLNNEANQIWFERRLLSFHWNSGVPFRKRHFMQKNIYKRHSSPSLYSCPVIWDN